MFETLAKHAARWSRVALAVGLLGAAGCCAHSRGAGYPKPKGDGPPTGGLHTFTIIVDGNGCPVDVEMEPAKRNCANQDRRCVHVDRNKKAAVAFVAEKNADFVLYFDPFLRAPLASEGGRLQLDIPPETPTKAYSFNLAGKASGCRVIDPTIIVW